MIARITRAGLCTAGFLLPLLMTAQIDRSRPPAPGPAPVVNLGAHTVFSLANGLRVIVVENHKLPIVGVQVRFDNAPIAQGEMVGYIDMMGDLLATGTRTMGKAELDEAVDGMGASLFAGSDGVYANGLKKHLPELMRLVTEVVTAPTFPDVELEKIRKRYLSSVQQRQEEPDAIADAVGRAATFGLAHPYGEVTTEKTIQRIRREQVVAYHARTFRPKNGYLVFVGDITEKEAKSIAKKHFGSWSPSPITIDVDTNGIETVSGLGPINPLTKPKGPTGDRRVMLVDRPGAAQSIIRVGYPLNLHPKDLRALSAQVMNTILGGGVFNARLMQNLREDKGWTYGINSSMDADRFNGSFHTTVSVRTAVTDSAIMETLNEMERMRTDLVSDEELDLAKRFMAGSFARSLEDPRTVARFALNTALNDLPDDHYATYLKRLEAVTKEDVRAAAEAFLHPDNAVILVVGDKDAIFAKLEPLSRATEPAVLELDYNGQVYHEELTPVTDRSASEVVEAYLAAIGGRTAIERIKDLRSEVTTELGGAPVTLTQWYGPGGCYRSEMKVAGTLVQEEILDGKRAVRKGQEGSEELQDIDLLDLMLNGYPVPEAHLAETTERLILGGSTNLKERLVYKVVMMTNGGSTVSDYYDAETGLKLRRVDQKFMVGRSMNIVTDYSDYKAEGGVLFPRVIEQRGGPMGSVAMTVRTIEVNKGLTPSFFKTGLPPVQEE